MDRVTYTAYDNVIITSWLSLESFIFVPQHVWSQKGCNVLIKEASELMCSLIGVVYYPQWPILPDYIEWSPKLEAEHTHRPAARLDSARGYHCGPSSLMEVQMAITTKFPFRAKLCIPLSHIMWFTNDWFWLPLCHWTRNLWGKQNTKKYHPCSLGSGTWAGQHQTAEGQGVSYYIT